MDSYTRQQIASIFDEPDFDVIECIQSLWRGYGAILRCKLPRQDKTIIVKHVKPPVKQEQDGVVGHSRKLQSFLVEAHFYQHLANGCDEHCRVAQCFGVITQEENYISVIMDDLDSLGYSERGSPDNVEQIYSALYWLANFHARFLGVNDSDVWQLGGYWYLATRQSELMNMPDSHLKKSAVMINSAIENTKYQTLLHGDAKLANFCFHTQRSESAAVDFQYVGHGPGIKDLMLLLSSGLSESLLLARGEELLTRYFQVLEVALRRYGKSELFDDVKADWSTLWPFVWADYHRFLAGWKPDHPRINGYMQAQTELVLTQANSTIIK